MKRTATHFAQCVEEIDEQLPLKPSQTNALIVSERLKGLDRVKQFQIRPKHLYRALKWLKTNNHLYKNVKITQLSQQELSLDQIVVNETENHQKESAHNNNLINKKSDKLLTWVLMGSYIYR